MSAPADCGHDPCQKGIWDEGWMTGLREGRAESADLILALKAACERALGEMGESVAADCAWCGGEGGWTEGANPQMTPVRHREHCPIVDIRAAIAKAEGK